jgi:hypothetical protein
MLVEVFLGEGSAHPRTCNLTRRQRKSEKIIRMPKEIRAHNPRAKTDEVLMFRFQRNIGLLVVDNFVSWSPSFLPLPTILQINFLLESQLILIPDVEV